MDATMIPHVLSKLDAIREHQVKEGEALKDIRDLLRQASAPLAAPPAPATVTGLVSSRLEGWIFSMKPIIAFAHMAVKHAVAVGTIWYLAKTGQGDKIGPYVGWLLGM